MDKEECLRRCVGLISSAPQSLTGFKSSLDAGDLDDLFVVPIGFAS